MQLIVAYRTFKGKDGQVVETYARSFARALRARFPILEIGEGHMFENISMVPNVDQYDFMIDLDSGRNNQGQLHFQLINHEKRIPSAVWFIDSHGHPDMHFDIAPKYDHVFFAVWNKRKLFRGHKSSYWCPNATDATHFNGYRYPLSKAEFDLGFFGSKDGLHRADILKSVCAKNDWSCDVREIGKNNHRWPATPDAMGNCKFLFNMGQKHDGPNQRVMESMAMVRPLLTNRDPLDGMSKLFEEGKHCLFYDTEAELEDKIKWLMANPNEGKEMAERAFKEVMTKHQVIARVENILEVLGNAKLA